MAVAGGGDNVTSPHEEPCPEIRSSFASQVQCPALIRLPLGETLLLAMVAHALLCESPFSLRPRVCDQSSSAQWFETLTLHCLDDATGSGLQWLKVMQSAEESFWGTRKIANSRYKSRLYGSDHSRSSGYGRNPGYGRDRQHYGRDRDWQRNGNYRRPVSSHGYVGRSARIHQTLMPLLLPRTCGEAHARLNFSRPASDPAISTLTTEFSYPHISGKETRSRHQRRVSMESWQ